MSKRKNIQKSEQKQPTETPSETSREELIPDSTLDSGAAPQKRSGFPIVGIGASAGGLEAFETFFAHMPPDSGMAFVLIQHLDPTHKSILLDLIKRHTQMQLFQVEDGLEVEPNCIYIIPPNRDMTIRKGRLYLTRLATPHGLRLPIDTFFRSLAEDQADKAICIILSGAGSDGTLGLKAIKERGGLVIAQDPVSARYSGMPQNAIATGLVDYILPPNEMPEQLLKYIKLAPFTGSAGPVLVLSEGVDALQKIFVLLRSRTGHDFSLYKKNTVNRRIERRMAVKHIENLEEYVKELQQNGTEVQALFKELLISVTSFFRDPAAFQLLESQVIPGLFRDRRYEQPIRVWVAGCATGEEAYCLAMLLQEQMAALKQEFKVQLFATDIDQDAITTARHGLYPESIITDISPERLQQFFINENGAYRVTERIRNMVICAIHSVIKDPPFSKLDLISCRNLFIYLEPELQKKVVSLFYYALKPGGILFLGASETLPAELAPFFNPIDRKWKIFQRSQKRRERQGLLDFVTPLWIGPDLSIPDLTKQPEARTLIEKLLLENYVRPCLVINEQSDILFIYGRVGQYLEPTVGEAGSWNILRLVREELRVPLGTAIRQALAQKQAATYQDVSLKVNDETHTLSLTVQPILKPFSLQGLMVVLFEESQTPQEIKEAESPTGDAGEEVQRVAELERELEATKEYLQAIVEELESSNEEIKSTNEELQSANEELETSQEVDTVNQPLLVLDTELRVISANTSFYEAFKVKAEETRGQLIYELGNRQWDIPRLRQLLEEIIPQNNVFEGFEVAHDFPAIGRKKMRLNARQIKALNRQPVLILLAIEEVTE